MINYYDPQFYEYQALVFLAKKFEINIKANYKIPDYSVPFQGRNELDGLIEEENGRQIAIEIKSYPLSHAMVLEITKRLSLLGFNSQILVAPGFTKEAGLVHHGFVSFSPDLELIKKFYSFWQPAINKRMIVKLSSGGHHFRYRLSKRNPRAQHCYLNQVDKGINSTGEIQGEIIKRIPGNSPPIKLLWSVSSFVNPKDLFFKERQIIEENNNLMAFDIDGQKVHGSFMSCEIEPKTGLCPYCLFFSKQEVKKLQKLLPCVGVKIIGTYFSGRSGFHVYGECQKGYSKEKLKEVVFREKVKNDDSVTFNPKGLIGFPESLNAISGYQLVEVHNLDSFVPKRYE